MVGGGGVHGCGGMHGCGGVCMVARGCAWLSVGVHGCGWVCMVVGVHGCRGHAWFPRECIGYNEIWSMSKQYASYWNAF